ncbi:MAG: septum formation initiator family protein [Gemmatimonadales bacterium]|nr:septum formation initiator family protein [Gemmatimonadales bacterium]
MTRGRWLAVLVLIGAAVLAWRGGIYSMSDYFALQRAEREARSEVRRLSREVDSLKQFRHLLETDPATQERVAREQKGMIRPGELSFIIETEPTPPDTTRKR